MRYRMLSLLLLSSLPTLGWANCVTLNVSAWTAPERTYLRQTSEAVAGEPLTVQWVAGQVGTQVEVCAAVADVTGLDSATLRTQAQALHAAQVALDAAAATEAAEVTTELDTSQFCRTATLQQIEDRLDTQHAAIQEDIDAITNIATAKTALTTQNTRQRVINEGIARCLIAWIRHQQAQP